MNRFTYLSNVDFKRGKDKKKRKKRKKISSIIGGSIGGTIGVAVGAATTPSEGDIWGNREYNKTLKYFKNQKLKFPDEKSIKAINRDIGYIKEGKNDLIESYAKDYYDYIRHNKWIYRGEMINLQGNKNYKIVNKVKKIRNNKMLRRSSIGLGIGLATGMGINKLYNHLKTKNE